MKTFYFDIYARESGAIGIFALRSVEIEAENYKEAELKLYDVYEHITVRSYNEDQTHVQS